ncbi:MAG: endonuclease MutS2, partial [Bacteroidales bacterium]
MTYPKNFEQKIGFDTLCELLSQECISELGLEFVQKIGFISDFKTLHLYLEQTDEFRRVLMLEKPFPSTDYIDLRPELKRLRIKGTFITIEGLQLLHASYTTIREIKSYFISLSATTYPRLSTWSEKLEIVPEISIQIQTILDSTGEIKDNASDKLASIRSQIRKKQGETQKYIRRYLNEAKKEGYVSEEAEVTLRNDRLVIPVTAAHKRSMKGFIHDISSSGQTVFMEPEEIFNLNNEIVELFNAERLEIIEILKTFTLFLLPFLPILLDSYHLLGFIDFLRAKARLAIKLQAGMPIISEKPCLNWRDARHPLLYLTLQKQG